MRGVLVFRFRRLAHDPAHNLSACLDRAGGTGTALHVLVADFDEHRDLLFAQLAVAAQFFGHVAGDPRSAAGLGPLKNFSGLRVGGDEVSLALVAGDPFHDGHGVPFHSVAEVPEIGHLVGAVASDPVAGVGGDVGDRAGVFEGLTATAAAVLGIFGGEGVPEFFVEHVHLDVFDREVGRAVHFVNNGDRDDFQFAERETFEVVHAQKLARARV